MIAGRASRLRSCRNQSETAIHEIQVVVKLSSEYALVRTRPARHRMNRSLLTLVAALALVLCPTFARADAAIKDQIYDSSCISHVALTAPEQSIINLYADPKGEYQPATMTFDLCGDGTQVYGPSPVTFRLKGAGSFRTLDHKAAFKVKMPKDSRIDGLKSFTFNNMVQDSSSVHEVLAYDAYRAVGAKAVRASYATLTINGAAYGLYANVETPDERFVAANFESTQHLYESPDWTEGFVTLPSRDISPGNVPNFEVDVGSESSRTDLEALAAISDLESDDAWWTAFQNSYAVQDTLRYWATNAYIGNWDSYNLLVNNYFLHSTAAGLFRFLPWGTDVAFTFDAPLDPETAEGVVLVRCLAHPQCHDAYRAELREVAESVIALDLVGKAHQLYAAIADAIAADPRKEMTLRQHCEAVDATIKYLVDREALWASSFRDPLSGIVSSQSSTRLVCPPPPPVEPVVPVEPQPSLTPLVQPAVMINDGAVYTNSHKVALTLAWPTGAIGVEISNDAAFGTARSFRKLPFVSWDLVKTGKPFRSRSVFARFIGPDGARGSAVSDSIVLDPMAPEIAAVSLRLLGRATGRSRQGDARRQRYRIAVDAKDGGSGVDTIQIQTFRNHSLLVRAYSDSSRVDLTTSSRRFRLRVIDRAGNASEWKSVATAG